YTTILPRQEMTPAPAAIFAASATNADQLGGTPASQFVLGDDPRLTDPRVPLPGSNDYVQNGSAAQQGVGFNVGGTGTAGILAAQTQFNLAGARVLSAPGVSNLFTGAGAGLFTTTGSSNAYFGTAAGRNTNGSSNAMFGSFSGQSFDGSSNAFFGAAAGG